MHGYIEQHYWGKGNVPHTPTLVVDADTLYRLLCASAEHVSPKLAASLVCMIGVWAATQPASEKAAIKAWHDRGAQLLGESHD